MYVVIIYNMIMHCCLFWLWLSIEITSKTVKVFSNYLTLHRAPQIYIKQKFNEQFLSYLKLASVSKMENQN